MIQCGADLQHHPWAKSGRKHAPGEPTEIWVSKLKNKEQTGVKRVMAAPKHGRKKMKLTDGDPLPREHPVEMQLAAAGSTEDVVLPDKVDDATRPDRLVLGCSKCKGSSQGCHVCRNPKFRGRRGSDVPKQGKRTSG